MRIPIALRKVFRRTLTCLGSLKWTLAPLVFRAWFLQVPRCTSVDAASCAARIIDEDSYELRTVISGRGLLRLVDQCGGLLRLDIANAANYASLIIVEDPSSVS